MKADRRFVRRFELDGAADPPGRWRWPGTVPAVQAVLDGGLDLPAGITVLVGENGSGKSTLVEMLAEAYGLNPQGGSKTTFVHSRDTEPGLGRSLRIVRGTAKPSWSYFLRADTAHGLYSFLEDNPPPPDRPADVPFHRLSHGQSFLAMLQSRCDEPGFYLMDEPDAPLSFTACLALAGVLIELRDAGSQIVVATHSPVVAAIPGATILEIGEWGIRATAWEELALTAHWRTFLRDPATYFRHL